MSRGSRPEMYWVESRQQWRKRVTIDGKSKDVYGDTKAEVREKVREIERKLDTGPTLDNTTRVVEYAQKWFNVKSPGLSHGHVTTIAETINLHICPAIGTMLVRDVKPLHIETMLAERQHLSHSHLSKILGNCQQIFKSAVQNGLILRNPCDGIKAGGKAKKTRDIITDSQIETLLEATHNTRAYIFVAIAIYTGMRREEILGLKWDCVHIDIPAPYLTVKRALHFEGNTGIINEELKSESARRDIPIPDTLAATLAEMRKIATSLFVVPATNQQCASLMAYRNLWLLVTRRVDFPVTAHMLRHTYITKLCDSGMDIKKIQYLAGHSTVEMTLNIYAHAIQNRPSDLKTEINKIFPGSFGGQKPKRQNESADISVVCD